MAELGVTYISVLPDTSKLAPGIKGAAGPAADAAGRESGKRFGGRFSSAIGGALKTAGKAGLVAAGVAAGATILGGVRSAIDQDKSEATLAGLYGSAQTASRLMKDLKKVASTSTIDYSTYTKTAEALAYMGISGKDAPQMLENIGDAISGAGGGGEEMDRAAEGLLKMVNAGKVELDSLNQLSDAGVPIYSALASQQGKSIANVRQMVTEGKIGIEDVQKAIANAEGESFKKQISAAKKVEKTLSGRFAILKDNVVSSLGTMFQPGIRAASDFVGKVNAALFEGGGLGGIGERFRGLFSGIDLSQFTRTWGAIKDFFVGLMPAIRSVAGQFRDALGPAVQSISRAFTEEFLPGVRAILPVIRPIVSFIIRFVGGALVGAFKGAVQVISGVFTTIGGLFRLIRAVITGQWGKAWDALKSIASGVMNTIVGAIKVWWNLGIIAVFRRGILLILKPFGKMFARLFGLAKGGVKKVNGALRPIVAFIRKVLGKVFTWLWRKAVQPAFRGIGRLAGWLWGKAIKPAFGLIRKGVGVLWKGVKFVFAAWRAYFTKILFPVIRFLWNKVAKPVFNQVGKIIGWLWNKVAKPLFSAWKAYFTKILFPAIRFLWNNVAKPIFNRVGNIIGWLWNKVAKPAFSGLRKGFSKVGDVFSWVWANVLKKPLDAFKKILDTIKDSIGWVLGKAADLKDLPGGIWGGVKGGASKLKFWATGGPVRGPGSGTSDSVPAMLSNGEYVISAAAVRKYGPGLFDSLNARQPGRVATFAAGGLVGSINTGTGSPGRLFKAIRSLVRTLREKVVPALLRTRRHAATPTTPEKPTEGRTGPFRKGRGDTNFLQGFTTQRRGGSRRNKDFLGQIVPNQPFISKTLKRISRDTVGMELAVGKSAKKLGKYWTDVERGPVRRFRKRWKTAIAKDSVRDVRTLDQGVKKQTGNTGKRLRSFTSGPVKTFAKNWATTFRKNTPADVATFRQRSSDHMRATASNFSSTWSDRIRPLLSTFGSYPRKTVAPAFGRGVDAIGNQWDRVKSKIRGPVRYVVTSVINGALIGAFNKIAKFVDAKTIDKVKLPKGFRTGGYTGPGHERKPAGIVHAGEYVINKRSTSRLQRERPGLLDDLNRRGNDRRMRPKRDPKWLWPGYWTGGGVMPMPSATSISNHAVPYHGAWYAADMNGPYDNTMRAAIVAWKDGRVAYVKQRDSSYGYETVINHADGNFTRYAHQLPGSQVVRSGQKVTMGKRIGAVGGTGNASGPHLHFEIKGGKESPIQGLGAGSEPMLPPWAQKIADNTTKWAKGLLDGGDRLSGGFGGLVQTMLNTLIKPAAAWAGDKLAAAAAAGEFGPGAAGVWRSLMSTNYFSKKQAAGVMGNMQTESGFVPNIIQGGGRSWNPAAAGSGGYGLVQWTPGSKLIPYLNGKRPTVGAQVNALVAQLRGKGPSPESAAGGQLKAANSVAAAARAFMLGYERPADQSASAIAPRIAQAEAIYKRFAGAKFDNGGLARGRGILHKDTVEPERILKPRDTRTFEHMVRANFQPANANGAGRLERVEMVITNWDRGTGYIQGLAAQEDAANYNHARAMGALR